MKNILCRFSTFVLLTLLLSPLNSSANFNNHHIGVRFQKNLGGYYGKIPWRVRENEKKPCKVLTKHINKSFHANMPEKCREETPPQVPIDVCPNLPDVQEILPEGYHFKDNLCVIDEPSPPIVIGKLLITEIYYDVLSPEKGVEPHNEWIEIYNGTAEAINLTGFSISDNTGNDILPADTIIKPQTFMVIIGSVSTRDFWAIPDNQIILLSGLIGGAGGLAAGGDRLFLYDAGSNIIDSVSWGTDTAAFSPSATPVSEGNSLIRTDLMVDTDSSTDWSEALIPTPGFN